MRRSYKKIQTQKTIALRRMHNSRNISLRRLATSIGIPESNIRGREQGRIDTISDEYIANLVNALDYTMDDWNDFLEGRVTSFDLKQNWINLLEKMGKEKLQSAHLFLESFAK